MANALPMMNMGAVAGAGKGIGQAAQGQQMPLGLAGLFGLLVDGAEGAEGVVAGVPGFVPFMPVKSMVDGKALPAQSALPVVQSVKLADGLTLDVTGLQTDVAELVAKLQAFTQKLTEAGLNLNNLGDVGELSAAFTALGMDPAEAVVKAQSIHTMLEVVKSKLGIKDENGASASADNAMALLMMAGLNGAIPNVSQNVEITVSVEQTTVTLVRVQAFNALTATQARTPFGQDVARTLAGVGEVLPQQSMINTPKATAKKPAMVADGIEKPDMSMLELAGGVAVGVGGGGPISVIAAVENITNPSVNKSTVSVVAPQDVIEQPVGDTLFTWKDDKGVDVVEKTPAHAKVFESLLEAARPEVAVVEIRHVGGNGQASVQGLIHVAEKITYAANHDVVGQVKVQVQQVVDNNGGVVRMHLNPPELGEVRIELRIANGEVSGKISATDATVVQELARDLQSLKQGFADSGLRLAQEGINLMLQNQNQQQQGQGQRQRSDGERFAEDEGDVTAIDAAQVDNTQWVAPDRLLDVQI